MKCEPITELGLAMAATRAGLRARMIFFAFTARRTRAMPLFAAFARAVVRAGFARRTVLRAVVFPTARRARDGLFFAVRFRDVLDLVNITTYPPQLKVSRPSLLWVNTV